MISTTISSILRIFFIQVCEFLHVLFDFFISFHLTKNVDHKKMFFSLSISIFHCYKEFFGIEFLSLQLHFLNVKRNNLERFDCKILRLDVQCSTHSKFSYETYFPIQTTYDSGSLGINKIDLPEDTSIAP